MLEEQLREVDQTILDNLPQIEVAFRDLLPLITANTMVRRMNEEIAVLRGDRADISTQLGLTYMSAAESNYYLEAGAIAGLLNNLPRTL